MAEVETKSLQSSLFGADRTYTFFKYQMCPRKIEDIHIKVAAMEILLYTKQLFCYLLENFASPFNFSRLFIARDTLMLQESC